MTHKTKMPEPDIFDGLRLDGSIASHAHSSANMDAYADARVREALEQAADICAGIAIPTHRDAPNKSAALECAIAIRRLIPQQ
ncbi:hypothetical protein ACSBPU_12995 [Parapusillimonas sp. JC17]|uniref:hypothetical protein n=1 Tax=Parapusillimonas sp. JC17 TaxID=3445768 RepID=UPI003FA09F93